MLTRKIFVVVNFVTNYYFWTICKIYTSLMYCRTLGFLMGFEKSENINDEYG